MYPKIATKFYRTNSTLIHATLLVALLSMFPVSVSAKSLCDKGDQYSAIRGDGLCLVITTYNADPERDYQPTLVVMLHGDVSKGGLQKITLPICWSFRRTRGLSLWL